MHYLLIINDPPYGTERVFNALRLAHALNKHSDDNQVDVFLMADAVVGAHQGQKTPDGYYNVEIMLKRVLSGDRGRVLLCGTCMDARGMGDDQMLDGAQRSTMAELAEVTEKADKVIVF